MEEGGAKLDDGLDHSCWTSHLTERGARNLARRPGLRAAPSVLVAASFDKKSPQASV